MHRGRVRLAAFVGLGVAALAVGWSRSRTPSVEAPAPPPASTAPPAPPAAPAPLAARGPATPRPAAAPAPVVAPPARADAPRVDVRPPGVVALAAASGTSIAGVPIAGVLVARMPKEAASADEGADVAGVTDGDGRLAWEVIAPKGAWIVVGGQAVRAAVLDGDLVDAATDRALLLEPAPAIEVVVTEADGRTPVPFAAVEVGPVPGAEDGTAASAAASAAPPAALFAPLFAGVTEAGEDGRAVLRVGAPGPARVGVVSGSWHRYAEPAFVDLPRAEGHARFRMLPACRLTLRVLDAATGRPVTTPFRVEFAEAIGDGPVGGSSTNPDGTGVFDLFPGLRPGTYRVRVEADGYAPSAGLPVELREPGEAATLEVRVVSAGRAAQPATLRLRFPIVGPAGPPWLDPRPAPGRAPTLLVRTAGPVPGPWGAVTLSQEASAWDEAARVLTLTKVAPGRYGLFAFDAAAAVVGGAGEVEVVGDRDNDASIPLGAGVAVSLASIPGATATVRDVRVEGLDGTRWPLVTESAPGTLEFDDVISSAARARRFVPVPGDRVRLGWADADGTPHERTLP